MQETPTPAQNAKTCCLRGRECSENAKLDEALEAFNLAVQLDSSCSDAYYGRALIHARKGQFQKAAADFRKVLTLDPADPRKGEIEQHLDRLGVPASSVEDLPDRNEALEYLEQHRYSEAIEVYDRLIQLDPQDDEAYNNRGNAYRAIGQHLKAINDYSDAIRYDPQRVEPFVNRANSLCDIGRYDEAMQDIASALRLNPHVAQAYTARALLHGRRGDHAKAVADLSKAIELKPDNCNAYSNRAAEYLSMGEFDKAIEDYDAALAISPKGAVLIYCNRARAQAAKGECDRAVADCEKAVTLEPNHGGPYLVLGEIYHGEAFHHLGTPIGQEYIEKAICAIDKSIERTPNSARAFCQRALCFAATADFARAVEDMGKAEELGLRQQYDHDFTHLIAALRQALHSQTKGVRFCAVWTRFGGDIVMPITGSEVDQRIACADRCFLRGEHEEAIKAYTEVIERFPDSPVAYYSRAESYKATGQVREAKADLRKAIDLDPDYTLAYALLRDICVSANAVDEAIDILSSTLAAFPDSAKGYYYRGVLYSAIDALDAAQLDFQRAVEINPKYGYALAALGGIHFLKSEYDRARECYENAVTNIENQSHLAVCYCNLGRTYCALRERSKALSCLNKSIEAYPSYAEARYHRGGLHVCLGHYDDAISDLTQALDVSSRREDESIDHAEIYNLRALAYHEKGMWERTIEDADKALAVSPENLVALETRASALANVGRYDEAIDDCTKLLQLLENEKGPANDSAANMHRSICYNTRASAYIKKVKGAAGPGNAQDIVVLRVLEYQGPVVLPRDAPKDASIFLAQALADVNKALGLNPMLDVAYYNRGLILGDTGDLSNAFADLDRATSLNPNDVDYFLTRGVLHSRAGHHEQAIADYSRALQLNPTSAAAWINRAAEYGAIGRFREEMNDCARALSLEPDNRLAQHNLSIAKQMLGEKDTCE